MKVAVWGFCLVVLLPWGKKGKENFSMVLNKKVARETTLKAMICICLNYVLYNQQISLQK